MHLKQGKRALVTGAASGIGKAICHELAEQQRLRATKDAYEGIRAVSERRPGNFIGE